MIAGMKQGFSLSDVGERVQGRFRESSPCCAGGAAVRKQQQLVLPAAVRKRQQRAADAKHSTGSEAANGKG